MSEAINSQKFSRCSIVGGMAALGVQSFVRSARGSRNRHMTSAKVRPVH
jgi:hypothetical protein